MTSPSLFRRTTLTTLALAACVSVSAAAHAADDWVPDSHQASAGGEIYMHSARGSGTTIPIIGFLHLELVDEVFLDVQLPFGPSIDGPFDTNRFALGNPTVGARYAPTIDMVRWWVGGGLSLPVGAVNDTDIQIANLLSTIALGGYDSYLFAPDAIPTYLTGGIDVRVHEMVSIQGSVEPIVYIPVDDRDDAEFVFQTSVGGEFRHDSGFGAGLDFKLVWFATELGDNAQVLVDPYFAYTSDPFFLRAGLLLALDDPLGFGFDEGGVASPHVTLGGTL